MSFLKPKKLTKIAQTFLSTEMKIIQLLALLCLCYSSFGQTIKSYSGAVDGGTSTYQYYEDDDLERIYNGKYTFTSSNKERIVEGSYSKNKKSGKWHYRFASPSPNGTTVDMYKSYQNGQLQGPCSYIKTSNATKKVVFRCTATFDDNLQVGRFTLESFDDFVYGNKTIIANYNIDGRFDGEVVSTTQKKRVTNGIQRTNTIVDKCRFERGVLASRVYRDITEGTVLVNVKRDSLISFYNRNYNPATDKCIIPYIVYKPWKYLTNSVDSWHAGHEGVEYIGSNPPNSSSEDIMENVNCCLKVVSPVFSDAGYTSIGYDSDLKFWYRPTLFDNSGQYYNNATPKPTPYDRGEVEREFRPELILGLNCIE